ncbi:hypothetical protein [Falsiroseomonas tokyonensis]|uniref:HEAT repeat domain-containing protein n=1 Tax=Falsiroseomonas tokyonensis TaxID=430521 RepID=A0ABV7BWT7_9PROT|nr:hypothetical protein [Falsiroseomonas tokyonensis]MBU8538443.1 hypothetical protein [Falsiroseomonas tokyonensis]
MAVSAERRHQERRARPRPGPDRRAPRGLLPGGEGQGLPALAGLGLAQALVVLAMLAGWWALALGLHLLGCLALPSLLRQRPPGWPGAVLRLLAMTLPALGPLAMLGALAALAIGLPRRLRDVAPPLPEDPLDARLDAIAAAGPGGGLPDGLLLESLGDVLRWGHARQKARALDLAAEPSRPGGAALLRLALSDPDPAVRARAEALRPGVELRLLEAAAECRAAARGQSGAAAIAAQRALARALDRAAGSGLLDAPRADACRAEAAGLWQALAEASGADAEAEAALGRELLALGDLPAARLALEAAVTRGAAGTAALGWLAECLFRARDFAALEALVARWRPVLEAEAQEGTAGPHAGAWRLWLAR